MSVFILASEMVPYEPLVLVALPESATRNLPLTFPL